MASDYATAPAAENAVHFTAASWQQREDVFALVALGNAEAAAGLLRDLAGNLKNDATFETSEVNEFLSRIVVTAQSVRDAGNKDAAVALLRAALVFNPEFLPLNKELLVMLIINQKRTNEALEHINSLTDIRGEEWILFWEAECYRRLRNWPKLVETYTKILPPSGWFFPFEKNWTEINFEVAKYMMSFTQKLTANWSQHTWKTKASDSPVTAMVAGFLDPFGKSPVIFEQQLKRSLGTALPGFDFPQTVIQFVVNHLDDLDSIRQVIFFHTIVSLCKDDAVRKFLDDAARLEALSRLPAFIKDFDMYVQKTGEFGPEFETCLSRFLQSAAVSRFMSGDMAAFQFAESNLANTCAIEICSRYRARLTAVETMPFLSQAERTAPEAGAQRHLFIGIFGQIRAPHETLPPQLKFLRNDLEQWRAAGHLVSFGVSTWDETGAKLLEKNNKYFQFIIRMPQELAALMSESEFGLFENFAKLFPTAAEKILRMSQNADQIDAGFITKLFEEAAFAAEELFFDISSEAAFMADLGARMLENFGNYVAVLNQGRMFHRIAAFAPLSKQAEERTGVPVTDYALIRPDVVFQNGSIVDVVGRAAAPGRENTVYCDLDTAAQYIDGMGDRYFIGKSRPVKRLFETSQILSEMLQDNFWPLYKYRITGHALPRTAVYESDCVAVPLHNGPGFHFLRGRFKLADVMAELAADAQASSHERTRQIFSRLPAMGEDLH